MKKIVVFISLIIFSACGGPVDEKQAFIDANVESACLVFEADDLLDPVVEAKIVKIYKKYGFDVDNEKEITALTDKYRNDPDLQTALIETIKKCSNAENKKILREVEDKKVENEKVKNEEIED